MSCWLRKIRSFCSRSRSPRYGFVPLGQRLVPFEVGFLGLGGGCVLLNDCPNQLLYHLGFLIQLFDPGIQGIEVGKGPTHQFAVLKDLLSVAHQAVVGNDERLLEERWGTAFFLIPELAVAVPDRPAVLVRGVPDLGAVEAAAVLAYQLGGK